MQANSVSMIDTTAQAADMVAPAKSGKAQGEEFGKVLNNQQRQAERSEQGERPEKAESRSKRSVERDVAAEPSQEQTATDDQQVAAESQPGTEAVVAEQAKPQQTLIKLMKVIAGGETPELVEKFGSSEELLNQLVQQLEGVELEGEQVLAGVDLTALVEQLQSLSAEDGDQQLSRLAEQIGIKLEEQLTGEEEGLLLNAELVAAAMPNAEGQQQAPRLMENLAQARQVLQQAIDAVAAATEAKSAVAETQQNTEELSVGEDAGEQIDPRFAGLLQPRSENRAQQSLRQQVQGEGMNKQNPVAVQTAESANQEPAGEVSEQKANVDLAQLLKDAPKQTADHLAAKPQGQEQAAPLHVQSQNAKVMPSQTPTVQLPSGQQVAESQIFDQVVTRFVGSSNGETGRMVLRLQPAELGSLKIELQIEGDRIRANLHAQSIQVQEVLERNLPQLRSALAEQGLKIDQFHVDVDQDQNQQGLFDQLAQQQQQQQQGQRSQQPAGWQQAWDTEEQVVPLAHLMQNGGGGLSLHV